MEGGGLDERCLRVVGCLQGRVHDVTVAVRSSKCKKNRSPWTWTWVDGYNGGGRLLLWTKMRWGIKSGKESRVARKSKPFKDANCARLKTNLAGGGNFQWTDAGRTTKSQKEKRRKEKDSLKLESQRFTYDLSGVHMTFECSFSFPRFARRGVWSGIVRYSDGISTLFSARFYITRCICIQSRGSIMHVILMLHLAL